MVQNLAKVFLFFTNGGLVSNSTGFKWHGTISFFLSNFPWMYWSIINLLMISSTEGIYLTLFRNLIFKLLVRTERGTVTQSRMGLVIILRNFGIDWYAIFSDQSFKRSSTDNIKFHPSVKETDVGVNLWKWIPIRSRASFVSLEESAIVADEHRKDIPQKTLLTMVIWNDSHL